MQRTSISFKTCIVALEDTGSSWSVTFQNLSLMIKLNTGFFKGPIWLIVENLRALASMEVELAKNGPKHGLYVVQTWLSNGLEKIKSIN